ncbi:nucleoside triphosphate pyrophosphohydrolase [Parasphingorhabdus sp. DH2-15]|uniref:nucleoside triphosphate pyrophosphohydrolase n=1 Tax=Parasphingorhabdus sp. DH2-15 TaxID=3444112 RepID=UPI003F6867A6
MTNKPPAEPSNNFDIMPLVNIMRQLRDPDNGCPWDVAQNFSTIAPYTIEEAYEVEDAIAQGDMNELKNELGDLLLQIIFHSQMADEAGSFALNDVITAICDKMTRRHPHVFGEVDQKDWDWEELKTEERGAKGQNSAMDDIALSLPAAMRAQKIQKRAAKTGFDWPDAASCAEKIAEEQRELFEATNAAEQHEEAGDLLFAAVNLVRHYKVDAETALRDANRKFERRFRAMEDMADGRFNALTLDEKEELWQAVKLKPHP